MNPRNHLRAPRVRPRPAFPCARDLCAGGAPLPRYLHEVARFGDSDVVIESRTAVVFALADGSVVEVRAYLDRAAAREAIGLGA